MKYFAKKLNSNLLMSLHPNNNIRKLYEAEEHVKLHPGDAIGKIQTAKLFWERGKKPTLFNK